MVPEEVEVGMTEKSVEYSAFLDALKAVKQAKQGEKSFIYPPGAEDVGDDNW